MKGERLDRWRLDAIWPRVTERRRQWVCEHLRFRKPEGSSQFNNLSTALLRLLPRGAQLDRYSSCASSESATQGSAEGIQHKLVRSLKPVSKWTHFHPYPDFTCGSGGSLDVWTALAWHKRFYRQLSGECDSMPVLWILLMS